MTRIIRVGLVALLLLVMPAVAQADPGEDVDVTERHSIYPRETLDDPPAVYRPSEDPGARSPGMRVTFGSYTSVQVNVDALGQNISGDAANEPSIAVSRTDPNSIVIGWRQFDNVASNFRQGGWSYTTDGGQSWTFPGVLTPGIFRSDPVIHSDSNGNFFYQSLLSSFDLTLFKSVNGGASWDDGVYAFGGDKNWQAIDTTGGIGDGNIYGTWQKFFGCCGDATFMRSIDDGQSFEQPSEIPFYPGLGTIDVGPDGVVYLTGIDETFTQDTDRFVVTKSTDAQDPNVVTPNATGTVVPLAGAMDFNGTPNPGGIMGQANVWVDKSNGPFHGYVYVLASVDPIPPNGSNPTQVHFCRSRDGGESWDPVVRVNDDDNHLSHWHWFGAHSVAPNGRIDVIWNDTRNTGSAILSELYYAYSYDAGDTWSTNVQVSPQFNSIIGHPNQNKIGDYSTIISDPTGASVAYAATFNGEQDVYFVRVFPDCNSNGTSDLIDVVTHTSLDCNQNKIPDECEDLVPSCAIAGRVPDGDSTAGDPMTLGKAGAGDISLTWDDSCRSADNDYAIYEGVIGDFTSHEPILCSTSGQTSAVIAPAGVDTYYLVVPISFDREGSYGRLSSGAPRPAAQAACMPQSAGGCFGTGGG